MKPWRMRCCTRKHSTWTTTHHRPAAAGAPALRAPLGRPPGAYGPSGSSRPALRGTARAPMLRAIVCGQNRRGPLLAGDRRAPPISGCPVLGRTTRPATRDAKGMILMNLGPTRPALASAPALRGSARRPRPWRRGPNTLSDHPKTVRGTPPPLSTPAGAAARLKCTAASGRPCPVPAGALGPACSAFRPALGRGPPAP